jgi:DNA-3-methyladenine glycosylase I
MSAKEKNRCPWCLKFDEYIQYHDTEWGVPVHDDRKHFEFLILEGAQAGLSWSTILKKRAGYRKVFAGFDPEQVARFTEKKLEKILLNPDIVRNRLKVFAAVNNAKRFLDVQKEFGSFDAYIWQFVNHKPMVNKWKTLKQIPATTRESDALSKDLVKRGFRFVGSTVMYAHMQACGLVNDHLVDCFRYRDVQQLKTQVIPDTYQNRRNK